MIKDMVLGEKILREIQRYHGINKYLSEQEALPTALSADPAAGLPNVSDTPPAEVSPIPPTTPDAAAPDMTEVDVETDADVTKLGDTGTPTEAGGESEELDITELVDTQKSILQKQGDQFDSIFGQLDNMTKKLSEIDRIMDKLQDLDIKMEKYKEPTPEEKLELRSLDSYPFTKKLSDFFVDKKVDMEKSGKNEYVLTTDDIKNGNPSQVRDTFNDFVRSNDENFF